MKIFVDIDGTICDQREDYRDAEPYIDVILRVNRLHDQGHHITYWTARGGTSGKDWRYITERQLQEWGCKYNELWVGNKPDFDIIVDDRARTSYEI